MPRNPRNDPFAALRLGLTPPYFLSNVASTEPEQEDLDDIITARESKIWASVEPIIAFLAAPSWPQKMIGIKRAVEVATRKLQEIAATLSSGEFQKRRAELKTAGTENLGALADEWLEQSKKVPGLIKAKFQPTFISEGADAVGISRVAAARAELPDLLPTTALQRFEDYIRANDWNMVMGLSGTLEMLIESRNFYTPHQVSGKILLDLADRAGRSDFTVASNYANSRVADLAGGLRAFGLQVLSSSSDDPLVAIGPDGQGRRLLAGFVFEND